MDVIDAFWEIDFGRAVHWRIPFMALDGTPYQINIYEPNYSGSVVVLKGGAQPFVTQETDDEDAFLPIRSSSGYITVICESQSLVDAILPVNVHDRYVELVDVTPNANKVVWNGYILPEEYSGDWNVTPFELQLPIASPIAACLDLQYSGFFKAVTIGEVLKKILYNQLKVAPTYIYSGKFANQTASMLTAVFSDIQFAEVETDPQSPAYGTGQNVGFGDDYSTIGDVLEAFCKLYGYVIHETPDALWFCSSDMSLTYFKTEIEYNPTMSYVSSETTETLTDVDLPDVVSAYNSRSLLPGKSKVRVYCEAEKVGEMLTLDIDDLEPNNFYSNRQSMLHADDGFYIYTRDNKLGKECFQYDVDQHQMSWNDSLFETNKVRERCDKFGANFLSYCRWKKPDYVWADEYDKYKNGIMVCFDSDTLDVSDMIPIARISSKRPYSMMNFLRNGIIFKLSVQGSKGYSELDYKWKFDKKTLMFSLQWGDYIYVAGFGGSGSHPSHGTWETNPPMDTTMDGGIFGVMISSLDTSQDEGKSELYKVDPTVFDLDDFFTAEVLDIRNARKIQLRENHAYDANGPLSLTIYAQSAVDDIKYLFLTDLTIEHVSFSEESLSDTTDHYLSDFRRSLSNTKNEEYEYEQTLNNLMADYSPSGVVPPATVQDTDADYFEQTILDRLANWFDRTIEQLNITVERTALTPGQRIEYNDGLYIVVSRADNWRDSNVTLTLQKLYEAAN